MKHSLYQNNANTVRTKLQNAKTPCLLLGLQSENTSVKVENAEVKGKS